ncbi:PaaI family thioesterase [Bacillus piscicola]|uniref:PaaI family thioesterase n=1 Tax=Bacillus piscicola TaxID=1632684 RepID=UPI001F09F4C5|nr:PaaI family thioesterase [Bacillus piscicola]
MSQTRSELQNKYTSFLESASDKELEIMERALSGWEKKRGGCYSSYVTSWLQPDYEWREDQSLAVTIPLHTGLYNELHIAHGGVTATLLDSAMGTLADKEAPVGYGAVTMEIKINYIKPGKGHSLRCLTKVLSKTKKTIITEGSVYNDKDALIAHATATFYVISNS